MKAGKIFTGFLMSCGIVFAQVVEVYEAGYRRGYEEGFRAGMEKAMEYFREVYQEKLKEYQEIEAGKLLLREGRISYPRVYNVQTPDGMKVVVEGCRVIAPVDDLLHRITSVRSFAPPPREKEDVRSLEPRVKVVLPESALEDVQKVPEAIFYRREGELHAFLPERKAKELCKIHKCKEVQR